MTIEQAQIIADGLNQIAHGLNTIGIAIFVGVVVGVVFK
jgi:hypothetical protein